MSPLLLLIGMITKEKIEALVNEKLKGSNTFLVDIQLASGNVIHVYMDKPEGISIDECVEMSRFINSELDRDTEDYELEVSSPGLSFPFKVKEQYMKYLGKPVQVVLQNGQKFTGSLMSHNSEGITIEYEQFVKEPDMKKKKQITENKFLKFEEIKTTKAVVSFK